jgi:hypothetical protein
MMIMYIYRTHHQEVHRFVAVRSIHPAGFYPEDLALREISNWCEQQFGDSDLYSIEWLNWGDHVQLRERCRRDPVQDEVDVNITITDFGSEHHVVITGLTDRDAVLKWCRQNFGPARGKRWYYEIPRPHLLSHILRVWLFRDADATLFKMRWG